MLIVFQGGGDVAVPAVSSPTSDRATKTGQGFVDNIGTSHLHYRNKSVTLKEQVTYTKGTSQLHYRNVSITLLEQVNYTNVSATFQAQVSYTTGTCRLH